jgi:hypothetical protein
MTIGGELEQWRLQHRVLRLELLLALLARRRAAEPDSLVLERTIAQVTRELDQLQRRLAELWPTDASGSATDRLRSTARSPSRAGARTDRAAAGG